MRDRKRNVVPKVYNEARLTELPMPVLVLCPDEFSSGENSESSGIEDFDPLDNDANISTGLNALNFSQNDVEITADNSGNNGNSSTAGANSSTATEFDASNVLASDGNSTADGHNNDSSMLSRSNDTNDTTEATALGSGLSTACDENDLLASVRASTSSANSSGPDANSNSLASAVVQVKKEPQFSQMDEEDADVVANLFDGSYEKLNDSDDDILIHRNDYVPAPITDAIDEDKIPYKVKMNDVISANIPFATNVSDHSFFIILYSIQILMKKNQLTQEKGDRAYIVCKGKSFKEVCLTKNVIDGLTQYNSSGFRESQKYHLRFIKSLLIGLIGLKKLAAKEKDELTIEFIRGEWIFPNYSLKITCISI